MSEPRFIAIEGIDRSGKTTLARLLSQELGKRGIESIVTYEPWHPLLTRVIQESVKNNVDGPLEALLFAADRLMHIREVIEPALKSGIWVISDRYIYSSLAYQTVRGADIGWVETVNRYAVKPDLAILLDLDPVEAYKRTGDERLKHLEDLELMHRIRNAYLELAEKYGMIIIDASRPPRDVLRDVIEELNKKGWIK